MSRTLPCATGLESSIAPEPDIWSEATNHPGGRLGTVVLPPVTRQGPARVLIAAADPLVRRALRSILTDSGAYEIVAETATTPGALESVRQHDPHVALVDVMLEEGDGLETAERIAREAPETRVIILSATEDEAKAVRALRAGARGYLR